MGLRNGKDGQHAPEVPAAASRDQLLRNCQGQAVRHRGAAATAGRELVLSLAFAALQLLKPSAANIDCQGSCGLWDDYNDSVAEVHHQKQRMGNTHLTCKHDLAKIASAHPNTAHLQYFPTFVHALAENPPKIAERKQFRNRHGKIS